MRAMAVHPSLTVPKAKLIPLEPRETMGPNELCWCRSGENYKRCHYRREKEKSVNVFELEAKMVAELRDGGYCLYPDPATDACSPGIIKAHTVQKKGGLAAIAEAGHVLTVKPTMKNMIETQGKPQPRDIGVNQASIFPGFCNKHDANLFKAIEGNSLALSKEKAFLFAFRAIAYERFAIRALDLSPLSPLLFLPGGVISRVRVETERECRINCIIGAVIN